MPQPHTGELGPGFDLTPLWTFDAAGNLILRGGISTYGSTSSPGQVAPQPGTPPAVNYLSGLLPSGDTTGKTDRKQINSLSNLGVLVVKLALGVFWADQPLVIDQNGVVLQGSSGPTQSTDDNSTQTGTFIRLTAAFANPSALFTGAGVTAGLILSDQDPTGAGTPTRGTRVRDLWIDCTLAGGTVDGIAAFGAVQSCELRNVGIIKPTGNGVNWLKDNAAVFAQPFPDGWSCYNVAVQQPGGYGFIGKVDDSLFVGCRSHSATLDGWNVQGLNCYYLGCRGDNGSANGFTHDAQPPSGSSIGSPNTFVGCGTQGNQLAGMNVTNSSTAGTVQRAPVIISGCMFAGDQQGGSATGGGINVAGKNIVLIGGGTVVAVGNKGVGQTPAYALTTNVIGGASAPPLGVAWSSGFANGNTGTVLDNAALGAAGLQIGSDVITATGYQPNAVSFYAATITLAALTVTGTATLGALVLSGAYSTAGAMMSLTNTVTTANSPILYTAAVAADIIAGIKVTGDANQRFKLDSNGRQSWGAGTGAPDCFMSRQAAGIMQYTSCSLDIATAGQGLQVNEGANGKQGTVNLSSGAATVANTSITNNSRIFLTAQDNSSIGVLRVSARTAGTSFTITSSNGTDSGKVAYEIFEPG